MLNEEVVLGTGTAFSRTQRAPAADACRGEKSDEEEDLERIYSG